MAPTKSAKEYTKDERDALNSNTPTIQNQITDNGLKKGEIAFFDENGNRLRSKAEGENIIFSDDHGNKFASKQKRGKDTLIIPTGTSRIVANCSIDITGLNPPEIADKLQEYKLKQPRVLQIYADGNVTGKNVCIPHAEIHATGNVDLTSSSKFDSKNEINLGSNSVTVVSGGYTKLNGFKEVKIISGGKKTIHNGTISTMSHAARISQGRYTPSRSACTAVEL